VDTTDGAASDKGEIDALPFVDEHTVKIAASRDAVWTALRRYVATSLRVGNGGPLAKILGTRPPAGFEVAESRPNERLTLVGRHRFSRYMLAFELTDASDRVTLLSARTHAAFPGVHGRVYRALVIGTHAHVIATRHVLRSIRRLAVGPTAR
jgi:hypothetical protein